MIRILLVIGLTLAVTACVSPRTARGAAAKVDRICAELRQQDPAMLRLAAQNWHMVPDFAKQHFKGPRQFMAKVRACRAA